MFARIAFDPGSEFQQRVHQSDMEFSDGVADATVIREAERHFRKILGIAVWRGDEWRTIHGTLPGLAD